MGVSLSFSLSFYILQQFPLIVVVFVLVQVGKVSMEWLAGEKTKVVGTFPPRKKEWTGYVEKDTAGQTNIYAVEVRYLIYN